MNLLAEIFYYVTAGFYIAASALFLRFLLLGKGDVGTLAPRLIGAGAVFHGAQICLASFVLHLCPVEGIHFPMSIVAMTMCIAYVVMRRRLKIAVAGAFIAPLALTSLLASHFMRRDLEPAQAINDTVLRFHVTSNVIGIAFFTLSSSLATLYLIQERLLKKKQIDGVFRRLPALDVLDRAEHRFLLLGFPLLTIGILTGTFWARRVEAGVPSDVLRAIFGYVTWLVIAGVLFLRAAAGWRGRRAAYGTIAGFAFAVAVLMVYLFRKDQPPPSYSSLDASHPRVVTVVTAP